MNKKSIFKFALLSMVGLFTLNGSVSCIATSTGNAEVSRQQLVEIKKDVDRRVNQLWDTLLTMNKNMEESAKKDILAQYVSDLRTIESTAESDRDLQRSIRNVVAGAWNDHIYKNFPKGNPERLAAIDTLISLEADLYQCSRNAKDEKEQSNYINFIAKRLPQIINILSKRTQS